jgi:hypothetical protein
VRESPSAVGKFLKDDSWVFAGLVALGALLVFAASVARITVLYRQKKAKDSPHDLESSLHALEQVLLLAADKDHPPRLRVAIHRVLPDNQTLEQVTDYVGDNRAPGGKGRTFPIQSGIVGLACRTGKPHVAKRKRRDPQAYLDELVTKWAYKPEDARQRDQASMSWFAYPLKDPKGQVQGVVFADSTDPDFFTDVRYTIACLACAGIANYATQRYS